MKAFQLFLFLSLFSCSQFRIPTFSRSSESLLPKTYATTEQEDFINQLKSFEKIFLSTNGVQEIMLRGKARDYIENLSLVILQNNELFFSNAKKPTIHVIKSAIPFHFSLPGGIVFLSNSLINKYIKHEAILASILAFEFVRSEKQLYGKNYIIPTGYLSLDRVLGINRIASAEKSEIHKWAYYTIRRAGFDGAYYLSWLQTMNRNTADFIPLLGEAGSISREEAMFKAFLIRRSKLEDERAFARRESSKDFYQFLFYVKDSNV
ncbi:MAG: hypothetical protein K2P81_12755 [Bacteriovoracaceae bacterium]|nr:hypothetical protein [Bacteriovoracaceae bacterium]